MIEMFAQRVRPVLDAPFVRRTRRNHALEHATVTLLSQRIRGLRMAGSSTDGGFILIGDVPTADIERAVHDGLARLQKGEKGLAVHPNCGTNLMTVGGLTTLVGYLGFGVRRQRLSLDRISWVMTLMMLATLVAQPLGMEIQRHVTTEGDPGDLDVVSVTRHVVRSPLLQKPVVLHRIITKRG